MTVTKKQEQIVQNHGEECTKLTTSNIENPINSIPTFSNNLEYVIKNKSMGWFNLGMNQPDL